MVASCTPWVASVTVSRSGHLVALMRLRNSVSSASGTFTLNGRMGYLSVSVCRVSIMVTPFLQEREDQAGLAAKVAAVAPQEATALRARVSLAREPEAAQ